MSTEVSDVMREQILGEIQTKNAKVMLSIPTSIEISRKKPKRTVSVAVKNISPAQKCYCVYPHLLGFDGPGSYNLEVSKGTMQGSLSAGTAWTSAVDEEQMKKKLKQYTPQACWNGPGTCKPNTWFVGQAGIRVDGEQANAVTVELAIPKDPLAAPNGRWAFTVDVCEYKPSCPGGFEDGICKEWGEGCDACIPENCRQNPVDKCEGANQQSCYQWYDSAAFHLEIKSEE